MGSGEEFYLQIIIFMGNVKHTRVIQHLGNRRQSVLIQGRREQLYFLKLRQPFWKEFAGEGLLIQVSGI